MKPRMSSILFSSVITCFLFQKYTCGHENIRNRKNSSRRTEEYVPFCPAVRYEPWSLKEARTKSMLMGRLQYRRKSWDFEPLSDSWNEIEFYSWADSATSNMTRTYASLLGYDEDKWDCCVNHYEGFEWQDLENWNYTEQIAALKALGWSHDTYGLTESTVWPESEFQYFSELTEYQRYMAASKLCFTEETWNEELALSDWPADFEIPDAW